MTTLDSKDEVQTFRQFSEDLLAKDGVQSLLDTIEARLEANPNILLYCCFASRFSNKPLSKIQLKGLLMAVNNWHKYLIKSLSKLEQHIRNKSTLLTQKVGEIISQKKLQANKYERDILCDMMLNAQGDQDRSATSQLSTTCKNLSTYLRELPSGIESSDILTIINLLKLVFPDANYSQLNKHWSKFEGSKRYQSVSYLQLKLLFD